MVEILCIVGVSTMSHKAASHSLFESLLLKPARFLIKRHRARRQLAEMLTMSDSLLRDIGLTRYDLMAAIQAKDTAAGSLSRVAAARGASVHLIETARAPVSVSEPYLKAA
jgi:uncharacterized protein YjiS (DUF1127 family)